MHIIGISGKIGAGKSTIARNIVGDSIWDVVLPFAKKLKEDIISMGFAPEEVYTQKTPAMRALLQTYGVARRAQDSAHWIKQWQKALVDHSSARYIIVDDVRFANEYRFLRDIGAYLIRLERDYGRPINENINEHISETELDNEVNWDEHHIIKDGDLDRLRTIAEEAKVRASMTYAARKFL